MDEIELKNYRVSVVIPTYNRAKTLKRALDSVFAQTFKPFEVIVVDDGSTDLTSKLLDEYSDRVKVIYQKNSGVSSARNIGVKNSTGDWIALLDSDDSWKRDKLKKQIEFHRENLDVKISQTDEFWSRDGVLVNYPKKYKKPFGDIFLNSIYQMVITPSSSLISREVFERVGFFDENFEVCEDYEFWLRATREFRVGLIDEKLIIKYSEKDLEQLSKKYWGMDRFRVLALMKHLNHPKYSIEILNLILQKSKIILKGAKKRGNLELIREYEDRLERLDSYY